MPTKVKRWVLVGGLVVLSVVVALWVWTVGRASVDLLRQARAARNVLAAGPQNADLDEVTLMVDAVRHDVVVLDRYAGWLARVAALYRWMPGVGPWLAQAPDLLDLADVLTDLGQRTWYDVVPAAAAYQQGASLQGLLPEALAAVGSDAVTKQALAVRAAALYAELDVDKLPEPARGPLILLGRALLWASDGLAVAAVAPTLLGVGQPQTYLVLALNEDELRPGGGFITGVGQVQVVGGQIGSMVFQDSYAADDFTQPYPDPPEPMRQFLGVDLWVFRDSNWSPDFPTAARQALELYRPDVPVADEIAGVVALDQRAVQLVLEGLGSVQIEGADEPVTADTVLDYMHDAWAPDDGSLGGAWWAQRKSFMSDLASAVVGRVESGQVDVRTLGRAMLAALDGRHIQVFVREPTAAAFLSDVGWDGGLTVPEGDLLAPVEANLGYNKASTMIARRVDYEVDLREEPARASTLLTYTHLSSRDIECVPESRYDVVYEDMMHRCYWAHLRLMTTAGVVLLGATPSPIPANLVFTDQAWPGNAEVTMEADVTVFSQALLLPTAGERQVQFTYLLPEGIVKLQSDGSMLYELTVRKQAGLATLAGSVTLRLPEDAVVLEWHPERIAGDGAGVLFYEFDTWTDLEIKVQYRVP